MTTRTQRYLVALRDKTDPMSITTSRKNSLSYRELVLANGYQSQKSCTQVVVYINFDVGSRFFYFDGHLPIQALDYLINSF